MEACLQTATTSVQRTTTVVGVPAVTGNVDGTQAEVDHLSALGIALVGNVDLLVTMPSERRRTALVVDHIVVRVAPRRVRAARRDAMMFSGKRK